MARLSSGKVDQVQDRQVCRPRQHPHRRLHPSPEQTLKDIKGALSGLHSDDKKTNPVPRLFKKALNRLSNEEKEEFDRFLAVDTFGPRALFPYSQKDGCNTDTFDQLMGTPSKPTRQDYVPSRRAIDDDSWADNDIPVKRARKAGLLRHPVRQKRQRKELGRGKQ